MTAAHEPDVADDTPTAALKAARAYLSSRGIKTHGFMLSDSPVERFAVSGRAGSFLPCQILGVARLSGWGYDR